ncbi:MAG: GNAT family N-acetyltransferase [Clostridia bacterium]
MDDVLLSSPGTFNDGEISLRLIQTFSADEKKGFVPSYKFAIDRVADGAEVGHIDLRVGYVRGTYYGGNIGYEVVEAFRGHRYAAKAVKLLLPLCKHHGMSSVIVSCAADNVTSRTTIEACGGTLLERVLVPSYTTLYREGTRGEHLIYEIKP